MEISLAFEKVWQEHKRRERQWAVVFMSGPVTICLVGCPLNWIFGSEVPMEVPFGVLAGCWLAAGTVAGHRVQRLKCPRCGEPFFSGPTYSNVFAGRCLNCGLPKWSCDPRAQAGKPSDAVDAERSRE